MSHLKKISALGFTAALLSMASISQALAQTSPAAAEPAAAVVTPGPLTANITLTNDYRYRGISQSNFRPAIQGGFDYAHSSGFYIGNWNSSISWISDAASTAGNNASAPIEMDFYGGFKYEWSKGFIADVGVLQYYYPTTNLSAFSANPNTTELYAAQNFTFDALTGYLKFSWAATTLFGTANSSGSNYTDLTANYDTGFWGLSLNAHVGYQFVAGKVANTSISNSSLYSYTDWKLGVTKDFGSGLSGSMAYIGTNAKDGSYVNPQLQNLGKGGFLISLTKTF
ncbi:TorF family putative porin [Zwartia sp.]|uniref:TorF family putative porin n=1 Tax=Zwartia sp. TaxID=2978004 RepID=UPI00272018B2|nr:TorF family putative porin [Zwartia sp.]MDO9024049.1 TorF family putative porin [Zwartia sp.]